MLDNLNYSLFDNEDGDKNKEENNALVDKSNGIEMDISLTLDSVIDPKYQNDLNIVIEMGYDRKMVKKVYALLMPVDINEALDFLTKENGIFHHDFMQKHGTNDECFICGEPPKNHINYRKSVLDIIRDSFGNSKNEDKNSNSENLNSEKNGGNLVDNKNSNNEICCDLCFEVMTEEENLENSIPCGHVFCSDCYLNYLENKIKNNNVGRITCMQHQCPYSFEESFIISHLKGDPILINKYKKFKLKSDLLDDPNVKFCPIKDCESYARKEGNNKYVSCLEGHKFCFECAKPWHGKKKCQDEIDKDFKKWKKNKVVKKCPKCKMWTEKNLGCNHMTCAECKYQWCWLCGGKYSPGHFDIGGPCSGLQFSDTKLFNHCICLYLYKFVVLLYQMIMMIFILPIYLLRRVVKGNYKFEIDNDFGELVKYPIWFLICLIFMANYAPLGFILFLVTLFSNKLREKIIEYALDI